MTNYTHDGESLLLHNGALLNPHQVIKQGLSAEQIRRIKMLHREKDAVMREAHLRVKQIEFEMQDAWGWDRDETKHTHRFQIPYPPDLYSNDV